MKFFKPEDFKDVTGAPYSCQEMANMANAKLEREGKVVYGVTQEEWFKEQKVTGDNLKALLIAIEPIEKCEHPSEKIRWPKNETQHFICDCGARVKPKIFEVCDD